MRLTLKAARVNVKLTQMEAAEKLNVSLKTLQNWEAGTTLPRVDRLPVICSLYKCTIEDLIF